MVPAVSLAGSSAFTAWVKRVMGSSTWRTAYQAPLQEALSAQYPVSIVAIPGPRQHIQAHITLHDGAVAGRLKRIHRMGKTGDGQQYLANRVPGAGQQEDKRPASTIICRSGRGSSPPSPTICKRRSPG
jgi:hypothetical protein